MARKGKRLNCRDDGRNIELLGGFCECYHIVFQHLPVNGYDTKRHLWLSVDEDQMAVERHK
jgi:hypothetical protein